MILVEVAFVAHDTGFILRKTLKSVQTLPSSGALFQVCIIILHLNWEIQRFITVAKFGDLFAFFHWHYACHADSKLPEQRCSQVLRCVVCLLQLKSTVTISGTF